MALLKKTQRSFAGGQLDKDLMGRQDLAKYSQGCLVLENFKVRKQGNVIKRSGTDLVCDFTSLKGDDGAIGSAKLIPLVQERESGLYILFTGGRAYLVSPEGVRMNDGTWSRAPAHAEAPSTLAPYSVEVPFADADLAALDWCQSGDTVFFAHRMYPPGKIMYSNGTLEYERIEFRQGRGTPPAITSLEKLGTWNGTGGTVHVEYAVTAVKDGVESPMSVPAATDYNAPWPTGCSIKINIDTSALDPDSWDFFNVYKKEADVFGLVGTTSNRTAFVDISSGFDVTGSLYPSGYTVFDKQVHLRESGNSFANVSSISKVIVDNKLAMWGTAEGYNRYWPYADGDRNKLMRWLDNHSGSTTTSEGVVRTPTAQKSAEAGAGVVFTLGSGHLMSTLRIHIGSLEHSVEQVNERNTQAYYGVFTMGGSATYQWNTQPYNTVVTSESTKWTGTRSTFTACPAKYFTATVEYLNGSTWTTSDQFDCDASVDQSNPGTGWSAVSLNKWQRTYSDADAMWSYTDASSVLARMDAKAPSVGATVGFAIPASLAGKQIRKVTLYGWTDSTKQTAAALVVNGIACYQSGANVNNFTDDYITPDLTVTPPKTEDHFVNPGEYPGCVQLYSQRLVYAATAKEPFTFWMSATGDLYNFDVHEYLRSSDAIKASTAALEMPRINRMLVHRDLMLFAEGGEWQVAPSTGNAVAPSTIAAKLQSTVGCAAGLKPIPVESDIIFCDGSGETLMATRYNFASDGYESSNLSVLSQRIFRNNPIKAMAYAQFPESTIECVLADGTLASLVWMREHDVCAWSRHVLGGGWMAKDVAANKSVVAGSSNCAILAARQVNAGTEESPVMVTKWAILSIRDIDPNDKTLAGNLRMDAVRTAETTRSPGATEPTPPETGDGETAVRIGEVRTTDTTDPEHPVTTVARDKWAVGCPFASVIKTTSPEFTEKETAQMEVKNATESEIRVIDGSDFTVRQPEVPAAKATRMKVAAPVDMRGADFNVEPGDADCRMPLVGTNTTNGSIVVEHDGVLPLSLLSVTTSYRVEYANHANGGSADD